MGAKKFDTSLETREIKLFGRDIPGFCRDIPGAPEKFEKKKFVFNFWPLVWGFHEFSVLFQENTPNSETPSELGPTIGVPQMGV